MATRASLRRFHGRIGLAAYQKGALLGPESGPLATVVSQDPIYVTFPVSQRQILQVQQQLQGTSADSRSVGSRSPAIARQLAVPDAGTMDFSDVTVGRSTDTVLVRAVFPNPERVLVDGQYVRLQVEDSQPQQALLVPQRSLLNDQAGSYVFVVDGDGKAQTKRIKRGATEGPDIVVVEAAARRRPRRSSTASRRSSRAWRSTPLRPPIRARK